MHLLLYSSLVPEPNSPLSLGSTERSAVVDVAAGLTSEMATLRPLYTTEYLETWSIRAEIVCWILPQTKL